MIKQIAFLIFLVVDFAFCIEIKTQSKACILMDAKSGKVLFEKNAHLLLPPASTTKIATITYALTQIQDEELYKVLEAPPEILQMATKFQKIKSGYTLKPYVLEPDGTSLDIKKFEKLPIIALLYGTMMASANDAANLLAYHLGGQKIEKFVNQLNEYLKTIGCKNTHFENPHGLHIPNHLTTAFDLALIAKEGMKNPLFRKLVTTMSYQRPKTNKSEERTFYQNNRLLNEGDFFYPQATGIKTGYTQDAKYCLVASAENANRSLIVVVLGSPTPQERYADAIELFNQAFEEEFYHHKIYSHEDAKFKFFHPKAKKVFHLKLNEDPIVVYYLSLKPEIKVDVDLFKKDPPYIKGEKLGVLNVVLDDEKIESFDLFSSENIGLKFHLKLLEGIKTHFIWVILGVFFINCLAYLVIKHRKYLISLFHRQIFRTQL